MNKIAIYPGSFDPFTNGHLDIVKKASKLFDKVYILIGVSGKKKRTYSREDMKIAIEKSLENIDNYEVIVFDGLFVDFAKTHNAKYIVRGLRNNVDYNYEESIAEINCMLNPDIEYVYFRANTIISSSMVKELMNYCQDISQFVPEAVNKLLKEKTNG